MKRATAFEVCLTIAFVVCDVARVRHRARQSVDGITSGRAREAGLEVRFTW